MVMGCWEGAAKSPWRRQLHTKRFTVTAPAPPRPAPLLRGSGRWGKKGAGGGYWDRCGNDPSAGSPTDTLLRLHLPLNGKV